METDRQETGHSQEKDRLAREKQIPAGGGWACPQVQVITNIILQDSDRHF